jgi:hypothetical protein
MPARQRVWGGAAVVVAAALAAAGCAATDGASHRSSTPSSQPRPAQPAASTAPAAPLPQGWGRLRLRSGSVLPYPPGWRPITGDPGTASAAVVGVNGAIRLYLNATPADREETLAGWARFRIHHNFAEGDRSVRLISARTGMKLGGQPASCVQDVYATSRAHYRELACVVGPATGQRTVLVAAAQPRLWARERPTLQFALSHFTAAQGHTF